MPSFVVLIKAMSSMYASAEINWFPNLIPSYVCACLWISSSSVSMIVLNNETDNGFPYIMPSCIVCLVYDKVLPMSSYMLTFLYISYIADMYESGKFSC